MTDLTYEMLDRERKRLRGLERIDDGLRALNQSNDTRFREDYCECDPSVGHCPCQYCAIYDALLFGREQLILNQTREQG